MTIDTNKQIQIRLSILHWIRLYNFIDSLDTRAAIDPDQIKEMQEIIFTLNGQLLNQVLSE